ncbi:Glyco_hydro_28 domain-containing protein, partial [Cephalotus follicularis]
VFNVMDFGAVADAKTDNGMAFVEAWNQACNWEGTARVVVPQGTYLVSYAVFQGPCRGPTTFQLNGVIKATSGLSSINGVSWITFQYLKDFMLVGPGTFDGQGETAWLLNDCSQNSNCKLPVSLRFNFLNDSTVRHIHSMDSKNFHINILSCYNLKLKYLRISAPKDSPNTDGIHIGSSDGIVIRESAIGTGDDCVSLGPGSKNIYVSKVFCGPGHGISVGSLGKSPYEEDVAGLWVRNCTFTGTENGLRIKTWPDSYEAIASNFTFEDIVVNNVANPIVIDQEYCPYNSCNRQVPSRVKISNVSFNNIRGTSSSKTVVSLVCSKEVPCQNVEIGNINLVYNGIEEGPATSWCTYVNNLIRTGKQIPATC